MQVSTKTAAVILVFGGAVLIAACAGPAGENRAGNAANVGSANSHTETLTIVDPPPQIKQSAAGRGPQEQARPTLRIIAPADNAVIDSSTVAVKIELGGELLGYMPGMDPATKMGNHIHVILDNQPYEAYYNIGQPFELRNVADGEHTLRVFPSRPWHESYKTDGAFQMIRFSVSGGGADGAKPATTNSGDPMSNVPNANASAALSTPEGRDMPASKAGRVDPSGPLLTYSRPKGEYNGADAEAIMIDFWLAGAKLIGDGGDLRVRSTIDGQELFFDKWQPYWLAGWSNGKHSIKLDLVDRNGIVVENGGYNSTAREITVSR